MQCVLHFSFIREIFFVSRSMRGSWLTRAGSKKIFLANNYERNCPKTIVVTLNKRVDIERRRGMSVKAVLIFYSNSRRTFISDQPYVQKKGSKTEHVGVWRCTYTHSHTHTHKNTRFTEKEWASYHMRNRSIARIKCTYRNCVL